MGAVDGGAGGRSGVGGWSVLRAPPGWHLVLALCAGTAFVTGSARHAAAQDRLDVPGVVLDVESGEGVADAVVRIEGTSATDLTDTDGAFLLRGVPAGTWSLVVDHVRYGTVRHEVVLAVGVDVRLVVRVAPEAIELEPIVVLGEGAVARQARTTGSSFWEVTHEEIDRAIGTSRHLGDLIRQTVPGLKVRQSNSLAGNTVCLEFRAAATISLTLTRPCNHPMVYLDGVPVSSPETLYGTLPLEDLDRLQMIPPGEAGARYGSGALYGVLLIETQRPGRLRSVTDPPGSTPYAPRPRMTFDWSQDPTGPRTFRAATGAVVGNLLGLGLGLAVGRQCVEITLKDELDSTCGTGTSIAAGAAAFALPALGSALGARWGGSTEGSVGRFVPALLGASMMLFPGYAFALSTAGGDSNAVNAAGAAFLTVGVPVAVTIADRLFRSFR